MHARERLKCGAFIKNEEGVSQIILNDENLWVDMGMWGRRNRVSAHHHPRVSSPNLYAVPILVHTFIYIPSSPRLPDLSPLARFPPFCRRVDARNLEESF